MSEVGIHLGFIAILLSMHTRVAELSVKVLVVLPRQRIQQLSAFFRAQRGWAHRSQHAQHLGISAKRTRDSCYNFQPVYYQFCAAKKVEWSVELCNLQASYITSSKGITF